MVADYLTYEDERNFGSEILDVAQRAARQAMAPAMERLQEENQDLREGLQRTLKTSIDRELDAAVPNWRQVNQDPRWFRWLADYDVYSGYRRQDLLNDATAEGAAQRVIAIFRGFLAAVGQSGQPGQFGQIGQPGPRQAVQPNGRIYTRPEIQKLYSQYMRGAYRGREAEWRALEADIIAAGREGRIIGALDLQTGLPMTL
jgi:hypothetical protein